MYSDRHKNTLFDLLTKPAFRLWRHVFFIIAFFPIGLSQAFFVFDGYSEISTHTIYGFGLCLSIMIIGFVYFNIYFLASHFLSRGEYTSYLIALLASVAAFLFLKYTAEYWILSIANIYRGFNGVTLLDGLSNLTLYSICIASGSISLLFKRWLAGIEKIDDLESKQLKNSIEEIKNRIQPNFLYTTLDYASERVKSEPKQASDTLFRLSELLRYQLYDSKRNRVLLESDIEFIRNYLLLERQNSGDELSFTLSVRGNSNKLVSPALFIPWIEEIVKNHPTEIHIEFDVEDCLIKFDCGVSGLDLSLCDFSKIEEKQIALYGNDIEVSIKVDVLKLQLQIC